MIEDRFQGWLVIDHILLKEAIKKLPPHYRTYKAIKEALGLGPQTLSDILEGRRHPNLLNFKKLCLYANLSADELLGLEKTEDSPSEED